LKPKPQNLADPKAVAEANRNDLPDKTIHKSVLSFHKMHDVHQS